MKGLWLEDRKITYRTDLPMPETREGEALIRLRQAGICSTDLEMTRGYYPFTGIPGHEFVGEVVEAPGNESWVGERVVGEINITCGHCAACRAGRPHHCENRAVLGIQGHDGVFAEYFTLPVANLHIVPGVVRDDAAVFTEPLAAALEIQEQVHIQPGMKVLVMGAGRLGMLIAQTLKLTGCDLRVGVRREEPARILYDLEITPIDIYDVEENDYDLVVEATGAPSGFEISRKAARPAGTLVLKSTFAEDLTLNMSALVVDEVTLVGSRCGPFPPALRLLEMGLVETYPMIDARYELSDGVRAIKKAGEHGVLKVLLRSD
ncbi:MAG: alcohol dehydrogenase catalytic domain-containing protein [Chloroflexota bacterium]|jgi:threonine dehydrogenase-like Zn-dependent dehydrogenase|nr:alcohol dehydrogenase catalytic domain-containing protein [Chloroflexota bacterium]